MPPRRTRSQDKMAEQEEESAPLAAAQAQAEAEEELRANLPQEVLHISRRPDLQQATIDTINGNISKLTEMVQRLSLSMNRPPTPNPNGSTLSEENTTAFQTPPQPHHTLSPIVEGNTPTTEMSQNTTFLNPARQIPFSQAPPAATSHQQTPHVHQHTNPSTHPHMDTPSSNQFQSHQIYPPPTQNPTIYPPPHQNYSYSPPLPPFPPQQQPNYANPYHYTMPPPVPYYPNVSGYYHYPPQNSPLPQYTYTPTQPTISPIIPLYPPNTMERFPAIHQHNPVPTAVNNATQEPYIRTPSIELPLFYGENACNWIEECESIFALMGIQHESKVKWANAHIRGKAKTWLSSTKLNIYLMNWHQFCELLCDRFPSPGEHETMEQFQLLK